MVKEELLARTFLKIHPDDNVLVALKDIPSGTTISLPAESLVLQQDISAKHKFFLHDMQQDEEVIMYGTLVGKTQSYIPKGSLMTTANTKHASGEYRFRGFQYQWE